MRSIHLMVGSTGEHDDYRTWVAAAFSTKARAETFIKRANAWLTDNNLHHFRTIGGPYNLGTIDGRREAGAANPYDPNFNIDYTGAGYERVQVFLDPPLPTKRQQQ